MADYNKTDSRARQKYWEKHSEAWEKSGLSQAEYCHMQGITKSAFGYWRSRLMKETSLVELPIKIESKSSMFITVRDQIKIEISTGFDPELLRQAVKALEKIS